MNNIQNVLADFSMTGSLNSAKQDRSLDFNSLASLWNRASGWIQFIRRKKKQTCSVDENSIQLPASGNPMLDLYYLEGMKLFGQGPYAKDDINKIKD